MNPKQKALFRGSANTNSPGIIHVKLLTIMEKSRILQRIKHN